MPPIIVSGFISNSNTYRNIENYINYGKKLIDIPINKIIFIEKEVYDEYFNDKSDSFTTFIFLKKEDIYLYEYYDQITNFEPNTTNPSKDTIDYMFIQCYKTEFIRMAIESTIEHNESNQFIWIDFGIYHIFGDNLELFNNLMLNLNSSYEYDLIRISGGIYFPPTEETIYTNICWCFLGGIFGGEKNKLLHFANLMKQKCIDIIATQNTITWEVNIWYLIYKEFPELFSIYIANHDATILQDYTYNVPPIIHPITFSIPIEKIVQYDNIDEFISKKTQILSNLIPGDMSTYIYNTEEEYYNEYQKSYFAITIKKAGWDCMRHYEILANGCIPYFINIEDCPINTLALLPKDLLIQANKLYKKFDILDHIDEYTILLNKLLTYTKKKLTTDKIATYILKTTHFLNVSKILYLSGDTSPDYLRCLTLHGFKTIFGSNCHDYPKIPHIYSDNTINYSDLYGKGITYTNLLSQCLHDDNMDIIVEDNIKNKYYDLIIYGSYHRGMPYYSLISQIYKPENIILMCGEDLHTCNYLPYKNNHIFIREY